MERTQEHTVYLYRCPKCKAIRGDNALVDTPGGYACPDCNTFVESCGDRPAEWVSIAVYSVFRVSGGPEEGGWHYDDEHLIQESIRCFVAEDYHEIPAHEERLTTRYGDGDHIRIRKACEAMPALRLPLHRPYYC